LEKGEIVKTFLEISQHSSFRTLPSKVQELLRIALKDNVDLLSALILLNPEAKDVSIDIKLDFLRRIVTMPQVATLLCWAVFDLDLSAMENSPELPGGLGGRVL
jgi:hypothetical protein